MAATPRERRRQLRQTWARDLATIDWARYETAYGPADNVPQQLMGTVADEWKDAARATHNLWCGLCHQHAFVSTAAVPALPFLLDALTVDDDRLRVELLDILLGLAICTGEGISREWTFGADWAWVVALRQELLANRPKFEALATHPNAELADFARRVVDALEPGPIENAQRLT